VLKAHVRKLEQRASESQQQAEGELVKLLEDLQREKDELQAKQLDLEGEKRVRRIWCNSR